MYFGLTHFTARAKVGFGLTELPEVMRTLHARGVKGFVTFNTLVFDHELLEAERALAAIAEAGADAIIVQDVGMAQLAAPGGGRASSSPRDAGDDRRVVEVAVSGADTLALETGTRVDVLVTSERGAGPPRTYLALQGIELADFRVSGGGSIEGAGTSEADATATLRVTLQQAVLLTAAENFARELRLVPRGPGDDRRLPLSAVTAQDLHP